MSLRAPFPWFGGKSRISSLVWSKVGPPSVYVEPFAGSLAVLLDNPHVCDEIVNDLDGMVVNAWRSIQWDPEGLKEWARWPVSELDMHARSTYCENAREDLESLLRSDPLHYDLQLAGWWLWGMSAAIGDSFIAQKKSIPNVTSGKGVLRKTFDWDNEFERLSERLKNVKIVCGDWKRVVKTSVLDRYNTKLVFLDPPYCGDRHLTYAHDSFSVAGEVEEWCLNNEDDPTLQIVLAGYTEDYPNLSHWRQVPWKAQGGYSSLGGTKGKENADKERLWFSPACPEEDLGILGQFTA